MELLIDPAIFIWPAGLAAYRNAIILKSPLAHYVR
jgi:hypothetical protein